MMSTRPDFSICCRLAARWVFPAGRRSFFWLVGLFGLGCLAWAWPALGQGGEAPTAQFVFVIDDSRSMSAESHGYPAADPDRLAVFAVRSLVSMLDDRDEVSVVRLNGPASGEEPLPPEALARSRGRIEELLALGGVLARYDGGNTPCRSALDAVARLLEEAYRPGVPQVVLFLTDGDCNNGPVVPDAWLASVRSRVDGQVQLYLLRFAGRPFTPELVELAEKSGGQAIEVEGGDPTALLEPFADALGRSQGYEAELLTPRSPRLTDYGGARRVRLLAVARGAGEELAVEVRDLRGRSATALGPARTGRHQFGQGEVYRYTALDLRPGEGRLEVRVRGADEGWKVVAVPEYRLSVRLALFEGRCDASGEERQHSIAAGETLCAVMTVVDGDGRPVGETLMRSGLDAGLRIARQEAPGSLEQAPELLANPRPGRSEFVFEQPNLEQGIWSIEPRVRLRLAGASGARPLPAQRRTLQATVVNLAIEPRTIDFGDLVPGQLASAQLLTFSGNFPETRGRLEVVDHATFPPCALFFFGDAAEGESVPIRQGQSYSLGLRLDPYCGPESFHRPFTGQLRLVLDRAAGMELPDQRLTVLFGLDHRLELPGETTVELVAGERLGFELPFAGNSRGARDFAVSFETEGGPWPADGLMLAQRPAEGSAPGFFRLDPARGERGSLDLEVDSATCCAGGDFEARVRLDPVADPAMGPVAGLRPIVVPLRLRVTSPGVWACRGSTILRTLGLLLLLALGLYLLSMVRNSRFLSADHLASSLVPLRWDEMGAVVRHGRSEPEVRAMVRRGLGWLPRLRAWLRANPLVFGLPGRRYHETVELVLQPERRVDRSRVMVLAERDHMERLRQRPGEATGRLFARAAGGRGQQFYAVPKKGVRIGRLAPEDRLAEATGGDDGYGGYGGRTAADDPAGERDRKPELLRLKKRQRLIHPLPENERDDGRAAGWQLG